MRALIMVIGLCVAFISAQDIYAVTNSTTTGPWNITPALRSSSEYLTANWTDATNIGNVSVVFNADITRKGSYSVTMFTPGCIQDDTCAERAIVNVTGDYTLSVNPDVSTAKEIYQTNNYDKYDPIYEGPVDVSSDGFRPTVKLAALPHPGTVIVAQRVLFAMINRSGSRISTPDPFSYH